MVEAASARDGGQHRNKRIGWLRAAVLGANDGIVSSASLLLGMATAGASHRTVLLTGVSALVAGAMSMAAGEFISVHSQKDSEGADIDRERAELKRDPRGEMRELKAIYVARGLDSTLAQQVSQQLMAKDALGAHVRDKPRSRLLQASPSVLCCPLWSLRWHLKPGSSGRLRRCRWSSWRRWVQHRRASAVRLSGAAHGESRSGEPWRWRSRAAPERSSARWPDCEDFPIGRSTLRCVRQRTVRRCENSNTG